MPPVARTIVFELIELIHAEPGIWCNTCMLPSAVTITLASQIRGQAMRLTTRTRCEDCEGVV